MAKKDVSDALQTRMREALEEIEANPQAMQQAVSFAMGYLMGSGLNVAAATLAVKWPAMFPEAPLPDRMREVLPKTSLLLAQPDLLGDDY